ncbi:hypothetical protein H4R19_005744, partial [Coemansia spiralis]
MAHKRTQSGTEKPADVPPFSPADSSGFDPGESSSAAARRAAARPENVATLPGRTSGDSFSDPITSATPSELARASGSQFVTGGDFPETLEGRGFIVDKSLLCKALLDSGKKAMRICLPRRFGKSFGLSVIAEFFNVVTIHDVTGGAGADGLDAAKARREEMFRGSLLKTSHPAFFNDHFAKYPVIRIDFKEVAGTSLGTFYKGVAEALSVTAGYWIRAYRRPGLVAPDAQP